MASIYFSDFFDVTPEVVEQFGAFNVSLVNDLPVFVDPFLLFNSERIDYQELHDALIAYMKFLKQVTLSGGLDDSLIHTWFAFPEVRQNWFGFSKTGNAGRGLGKDFANALYRNFASVFNDFGEETLTRSSHIEKLCLIRSGVGRDNLSDFTTNLIKRYLAQYTQEFARNVLSPNQRRTFRLDRSWFNYQTHSWVPESFELPAFEGDFVLLTPIDMLTRDDAWINRDDLVTQFRQLATSMPDHALRAQLDRYLQERLSQLKDEPNAKQWRAIVENCIDANPAILDHYIKRKEEDGDSARTLSAEQIEETKQAFVAHVREFVESYLVPGGFYNLGKSSFDDALARVRFLKDVIENKGGHKLFYIDGKPVQREADLHLLYRLTWFASTSVVSREVNDGRGPADYQVARGPKDKVLVEFKLAKNSQLRRNLENQCKVYEAASDATHPSIKVILYFDEQQFAHASAVIEELGLSDRQEVVLIDARGDNKPSGSKA